MDLPVALASGTGLRRGEVLGLYWADVDLENGTLTVRRSLETTSKGGLVFKQPKSKQSRRTVSLPPFVVEAFVRHKARQAEHRLGLGDGYVDRALVMAGALGGPMHPDSTTTMFRRLAKRRAALKSPTTACDTPAPRWRSPRARRCGRSASASATVTRP
jgi:integrase